MIAKESSSVVYIFHMGILSYVTFGNTKCGIVVRW